ncbi:MAG: ATP-binding cassette domain-containing protein [Defluviitaleaceae bacterium]|nr:ATP-binding cassette domain-containing protein [Defluviitaleaceae bacterium]
MSNNETVLDVRGLKQYFTSGFGRTKTTVKAVDGIDFTIKRGQTFGLVGESGCGKTTTGRSIIRLYKPTEGEVYFNGSLISGKLSREEKLKVTQGIQMIFQDPISSLNPRMTVREIVGEGLIINKLVKNDAELTQRVVDIIRMVGLQEDHITRYPHEFSGGQRQRIGIARVLISNPSLIIADEPISALDVSIQAQVLNLLNSLKKKLGLTILFIAHDLSVVKYFSDYVGVMYNGKIVEFGSPSVLYANPAHPYTRALLSAIPIPDPAFERGRGYITYDPTIHDYSSEQPEMHNLGDGHFVYLSKSELTKFAVK